MKNAYIGQKPKKIYMAESNSEKPLLLMDIDGPLNPYAGDRPELFEDGYHLDTLYVPTVGMAFRVMIKPALGAQITEQFGDRFELTWCTWWEESADTVAAPAWGLPRNLPQVDLSIGKQGMKFSELRNSQPPKLPGVEAYVGDRPFVWFDDEHEKNAWQWVEERNVAGTPSLLVHVPPEYGLQEYHFSMIETWYNEHY